MLKEHGCEKTEKDIQDIFDHIIHKDFHLADKNVIDYSEFIAATLDTRKILTK